MSKIIAMLITVSTLFLPSIIQAKPISIKVAYENNPGNPGCGHALLGRPIKQKK